MDYLATRPGEVIGPTELAASVWRRDDQSAVDVVKVTISHLRRKLGAEIVQTVHGGYRLGPSRGDGPDDLERQQLLRVLTETDWNLSDAAARLGVPRSTLHYRVERQGLGRRERSAAAAPGP